MIARALLRFLQRTPLSTLMAVLGVALGVTSIVSVHLISATVAERLDELIPRQLAGFTHFLHRADLEADDYFDLRRRWRGGALPDVEGLSPLIDERLLVDARQVRAIGVDLFSADIGVVEGAGSEAAEEWRWDGVWVDESLVDVVRLPVNGIIAAPPGTLVGDIGVVQDLLGWPSSRISYVGARFVSPWDDLRSLGEALLPGLDAGLPEVTPALSEAGWQIVSLARQHPASQFGKSVLFNISALGALALLVAWFLMYQVAVSWLRRLWPVFERLHVLGVSWRELGGYFAAAMLVLGVVAGGLGLAAGYLLAVQLYGIAIPQAEPEFSLDAWVVLKAAGSSVAVCLLGGAVAFNRARHGIPAERRLHAALILPLAALAGVAFDSTGLIGGFFSIAVLSVLTALAVVPLLNRLRLHSQRLGGPLLVRLSLRELFWYPREFSIALAGLSLAVATAIGVGLMIDSFRADFSRMLDRRLTYDVVVRGGDELAGIASELAATADVSRLQRYQTVALRIEGAPFELIVTTVDAFEAARYGLSAPLAPDAALLSEQGARTLGRGPGDTLEVEGRELRVAGVFSSFGDLVPRIIVDKGSGMTGRLESLSINADDPARVLGAIRRLSSAAEVELQADLRRIALDTFDQTFAITAVLITIAMVVAGIGVYVAVTTLRLNRRSSTRLLHGLGIVPGESALMDLSLGLGLGAMAVVLALPLGLAFGWILCEVINPRAFGWTVALALSADALATPAFWGLLAAAVAGVLRFGRDEEGTHVART